MASKNNDTIVARTAEAKSAYEYREEFYEQTTTDLNSKKHLFLCKLYPPLSEETCQMNHIDNEFKKTSN